MPNVNDSPLFQNRLLLDLSNGFNPSRELPICIAVSVDGQRCGFSPELLTSDPAPFVGLTNSTVIYGMETGEKRQDRTIYK
ncbi:MAG TPA: hypothetical protein PKC98_20910, partial [Candidatus Melainabacteria bacterium]|nr:hypothetical protein [Candidatus Melainabacteria bacterium]